MWNITKGGKIKFKKPAKVKAKTMKMDKASEPKAGVPDHDSVFMGGGKGGGDHGSGKGGKSIGSGSLKAKC